MRWTCRTLLQPEAIVNRIATFRVADGRQLGADNLEGYTGKHRPIWRSYHAFEALSFRADPDCATTSAVERSQRAWSL